EIRKKENLLQQEQWAYLSTHPSKRLHSFFFDDDDEDYTSTITPDEPVLSTEDPDNSLSMGDEHLGIPEHMCDVPSHDNSLPLDVSKDTIEDISESNEEFSSTDDDSFSLDKIDYVEASPPNSKLVSLEDSDSLMEENDLFCTPDYPMPPGIKDKDYDSERDILILKDLPSNNT
nr:hypothetical protein [Tanacetum cinerariifolium]